MEKLKAVNQWLTLVANVSVVAGILFLAIELQQNTQAIQAQTRDAITEKQMEYAGWIATNFQLADVYRRGRQGYDQLESTERMMFALLIGAMLREAENSHYQYEQGLFSEDEFQARWVRWEGLMREPGIQEYWSGQREAFAPSFRSEIDRLVSEAPLAGSN